MDKRNEQKKFLIKVVCVLLSFGLWLYITNVENPTRTYDLKNVPVELINTDILEDSNFALAPKQNVTVNLKLEGPANELYAVKAEDIKIKADLGAYALKKGENNIPVQIVNYPQNISIKSNGYLVVKVKIEELVKKEVKVYSKVKLSFKEGYSQSSIDVKPAVVEVSGAESLIKDVVGATLVGSVENISDDFNSNFAVKAVNADGDIVEEVNIDNKEGTLALKVGVGKIVNIKGSTTGQLSSGLSFDGLELSRATIGIVGDPKILEKITTVEIEPINISNIRSTKDVDAKIILPDGVKTANNEEYISVKVKVSSKVPIERVINANVSYINLDNKFSYEGSSTVPITISAHDDIINSITAENIKVEVDLAGVIAPGEQSLVWKATVVDSDKNVALLNSTGNITVKITAKKQ